MMKLLMSTAAVSLLIGTQVQAGDPLLECYYPGQMAFTLNLKSLPVSGVSDCRHGYLQSKNQNKRYFVNFCESWNFAEGRVEVRDVSDQWVLTDRFSTKALVQYCRLRRSIAVDCLGGRIDLCQNPGGH